MDESDEVLLSLSLPPESERQTIRKKDRSWSKDCKHREMQVDAVLRRVTCGRCGEQLDPIECLLNLSDFLAYQESILAEIKHHRAQDKEKAERAKLRRDAKRPSTAANRLPK